MKFYFTILVILVFALNDFGQQTLSTSNNETKTKDLEQANVRINQITNDAGRYFKQALLSLQDNRRAQAHEDFDKSVEVFLMSGVNVQSNQKLRECYSQLTETIYRMEFPSNQVPQIRSLSATCDWNIDNKLADDVARLVQSASNNQINSGRINTQESLAKINLDIAYSKLNKAENELKQKRGLLTTDTTSQIDYNQAKLKLDKAQLSYNNAYEKFYNSVKEVKANPFLGFVGQKFEASPLDELAKLELTQDEQQINNNPVAQKQLQLKPRIIKAKSGDTVAKIAAREGVSAIELAKYNGLLPNSALAKGREIKIPVRNTKETWQNISNRTGIPVEQLIAANSGANAPRGKVVVPNSKAANINDNNFLLGDKPSQAKDGKVRAVIVYYNENFNDPYSMRFVRWSNVEKTIYNGKLYWSVQVKFRAKNTLGAYILLEEIYYIRKNKVVQAHKLN